MTCEKSQEALQAYLDGELGDGEASAVRTHLESCDRCRAEAALYGALFDALAAQELVSPPPELAQQIMAEVKVSPGVATGREILLAAASVLVTVALGYLASATPVVQTVVCAVRDSVAQFSWSDLISGIDLDVSSWSSLTTVAELTMGTVEAALAAIGRVCDSFRLPLISTAAIALLGALVADLSLLRRIPAARNRLMCI